MPLRIALAILALGALLPSLIFFALEYRTVADEKQAEIERQGRLYARSIGDDITREVAVKETQLRVLGTSQHLRADSLDGFHEQAERASVGLAGWIVLLSAEGRQLVNTVQPSGRELPRTQTPQVLKRVLASGRCEMSDLFRSALNQRLIVTLVCPVPGTSFALSGPLPTDYLSTVVRRQTPEGWVSTVVDRQGLIVARSADHGTAVGSPLPAGARDRIAAGSNGWVDLTLDGENLYAGWQRLPNGWTVFTAVPRAIVDAPMVQWKWGVLGSFVVFSGLAFLCAALVGEWIIRAMQTLSTGAATIGAGGVIEHVHSSIREVDEVGQALAHASHDRAKGEIANAHLAAIVSSSGDAIVSVSLDGEILSWNAAAETLYGYRADEVICRPHAMLIPPGRLKEMEDKITAALAGRSLRLETMRVRKDGSLVEVSLDAAPIRSPDGTVVGISIIAHDISQRKRNEAHIEFVMRELSHRTKNLITVIIAMARRTARQSDSFADFETKFTGRLHGLARSHDLLVHMDWLGASIEELVRLQLEPFVTESASLQMEGPTLMLRPEAVQNLGFALHELATNANKYGALGHPGGEVSIRWTVENGGDSDPRVRLSWREAGGPEVDPPERTGFGSTVIQKLTEASLNATVTMAYAREGFRWEVDMPARDILSDSDPVLVAAVAPAPARMLG